ncbi:hypothetical protein GF360_00995 [candidate division WWE3 bacterium]|nr:hypothetical protein [candidate division WWE3 bacterium]
MSSANEVETAKLDLSEIREGLLSSEELGFELTEEEVNEIIDLFWFKDYYNAFVRQKEAYASLKSFLRKKHSSSFSRSDFYNHFVRSRESNSAKLGQLETLAYALELLQQNKVENSTLQQLRDKGVLTQDLATSSLITYTREDGVERLCFLHHTVQEYLAAQYILKRENPVRNFLKTAIFEQEGIRAFKHSWLGVYAFLTDTEHLHALHTSLVEFLEKNPLNINENLSQTLTNVSTTTFSEEECETTFHLFYDFYQELRVWFPVWTGQNLAKFVTPKAKDFLFGEIGRVDIDTDEGYTKAGNIASLLGPLVEFGAFESGELTKVKNILINYATSDVGNGVLQRHSLHALENFDDPSIVEVTKDSYEFEDKLVKQAFLQLAYTIAPNLPLTIDYLVRGTKEGLDIYARYGFFEISSKEGIVYFLKKMASDEKFFKAFLDKESIFDGGRPDREKSDRLIIEHVIEVFDEEVLSALEDVVTQYYALNNELYYDKSYIVLNFLKEVLAHNKTYFSKVVDAVKSEKEPLRNFGAQVELLALTYRPEYANLLRDLDESFEEIYNENAKSTIEKARNRVKPLLQGTPKSENNENSHTYQEEQIKEILQGFEARLHAGGNENRYMTDVFRYYLNNKEILENRISPKYKEGLQKIAKNALDKAKVREFSVTIEGTSGNSKHYTLSPGVAQYFGEAARVLGELLGRNYVRKHYRQKLIDYIPFAYYEDQRFILDIAQKVEDAELSHVNSCYLSPNSDSRRLMPSAYTYTVEQLLQQTSNLSSPAEVVQSLIEDPSMEEHVVRSSLEVLRLLTTKGLWEGEEYLKKLFQENKTKEGTRAEIIRELSNEILIRAYEDREAIWWRFNQIEKRAQKHTPKEGVHSVSTLEGELSSLTFFSPLIDLKNPLFLPNFLSLLDFTIELLEKDSDFWSYVLYIWKGTEKYIANLSEKGSFVPFQVIYKWFRRNNAKPKVNWFWSYIQEAFSCYVAELGKGRIDYPETPGES